MMKTLANMTGTTILFGFLLFSTACQKSIENPLVLYEKEEYKAAFERAVELAGNNDAMALYILGRLYAEGKGVRQDYKQASRYYRAAAEQEHPEAMFALGELSFLGKGVPQNDKVAAAWFRRAAEEGSLDAEQVLARMYNENRGDVTLQDVSPDASP
ncbi:tetratricopeptide repeat protein [Chlorobium limicola]